MKLKIHDENISVQYLEEKIDVSLKWLRGASRYNNGATMYEKKYLFRWLMGLAQAKKIKAKIPTNK